MDQTKKRTRKRIIQFGLIVLLTAVVLVSAVVINRTQQKDAPDWESISVHAGNCKIEMSPKIELMSTIWMLMQDSGESCAQLINDYQTPYMTEVRDAFSGYQEENAVQILKKINQTSKRGISTIFEIALYLTDDFTLPKEGQVQIPAYILEGVSSEVLEQFIAACVDFADKTDFLTFFHSQTDYFKGLLLEGEKAVSKDMIERFESYYGMKLSGYHAVLFPMRYPGGFGVRVGDEKQAEAYFLMAPNSEESFFPPNGFQELLWHEFSHSFVNTITQKNSDLVAQCELSFNMVKPQMNKINYGECGIFVDESLVRSVVARLVLDSGNEARYQEILNEQEALGFIYTEALCAKLAEFEQSRDQYKTFEEFFPEFISVLIK